MGWGSLLNPAKGMMNMIGRYSKSVGVAMTKDLRTAIAAKGAARLTKFYYPAMIGAGIGAAAGAVKGYYDTDRFNLHNTLKGAAMGAIGGLGYSAAGVAWPALKGGMGDLRAIGRRANRLGKATWGEARANSGGIASGAGWLYGRASGYADIAMYAARNMREAHGGDLMGSLNTVMEFK